MDEEQAYLRMREELGGGFFPTSLHVPISIAVGNVNENHILEAVESLARRRPIRKRSWCASSGAAPRHFAGCLVTFNGRGFDLPVLELHALRHGISVPSHLRQRARRGDDHHLDLQDFLTNRGEFRIRGGLNLLLKSIGLPGKTDIDGAQVQELYEAGRLDEIHRYCRSDVIQTYFLFIRVELMRGRMDQARYQAAAAASAHFLAPDRRRPGAGSDR